MEEIIFSLPMQSETNINAAYHFLETGTDTDPLERIFSLSLPIPILNLHFLYNSLVFAHVTA